MNKITWAMAAVAFGFTGYVVYYVVSYYSSF